MSNPYQTIEMFEFWKVQKNYTPFVFFLESNNGSCLAFCTGVITFKGKGRMKIHSKSAIIYGGPLISETKNREEVLNFLLDKIQKYLLFKTKHIEFRNFFLNKEFKQVFLKNKWRYTPKVKYIVNLTSEDEVFSRFKANKRTQIRKALREGVEISYEKNHENVKGVYDILKNIYRINFDTFLLPLPNLNFLFNLILLENVGLTTIRYENKIIAGEFYLIDDSTIYGWFGGGLNVEFKNQSPMSVSNWATMKYGLQNNIKKFDYGGAGLKNKENRLGKFKSAFGGELIENGMFSKINLPFLYGIENKLFKLRKKMTF